MTRGAEVLGDSVGEFKLAVATSYTGMRAFAPALLFILLSLGGSAGDAPKTKEPPKAGAGTTAPRPTDNDQGLSIPESPEPTPVPGAGALSPGTFGSAVPPSAGSPVQNQSSDGNGSGRNGGGPIMWVLVIVLPVLSGIAAILLSLLLTKYFIRGAKAEIMQDLECRDKEGLKAYAKKEFVDQWAKSISDDLTKLNSRVTELGMQSMQGKKQGIENVTVSESAPSTPPITAKGHGGIPSRYPALVANIKVIEGRQAVTIARDEFDETLFVPEPNGNILVIGGGSEAIPKEETLDKEYIKFHLPGVFFLEAGTDGAVRVISPAPVKKEGRGYRLLGIGKIVLE